MDIKAKRQELDMKQGELAERCGVSQSLICDIEAGRCNPSLETAKKIMRVLGIDSIDFFGKE